MLLYIGVLDIVGMVNNKNTIKDECINEVNL